MPSPIDLGKAALAFAGFGILFSLLFFGQAVAGDEFATPPAKPLVSNKLVTQVAPLAQLQRTVPDLRGKPLGDAKRLIIEQELVVGKVTYLQNADPPAGTVQRQSPSPSSTLPPQGKVDLWVVGPANTADAGTYPAQSQQPAPSAKIPNLYGMTIDEATKSLSRVRLKIGSRSEKASPRPAGTIIEQSPSADSPVNQFKTVIKTVNIVLAKAEAPQYGVPVVPPRLAPRIKVPSLLGLPVNQVNASLPSGLSFSGSAGYEPSTAPRNTVLQQEPAAGTVVVLGTAIRVRLSDGSRVLVPNLSGKSSGEVITALQAVELKLGNRVEVDANSPPGQVLKQLPPPNTEVQHGSLVNVWVARQLSTVPNLIGLAFDQAQALLIENSLAPGKKKILASTKEKNQVLNQDPQPGTTVTQKSTVDVTLSDGTLVEVPPLENKQANSVGEILASHDLRLGAVTQEIHVDKNPGTILQQAPRAKTIVKRGSEVKIWVVSALVPVPYLVGHIEGDAATALRQAGLQPGQRLERDSWEASSRVVAQDPPGGREVPRGSAVALTVARHSILLSAIHTAETNPLESVVGALTLGAVLGFRKKLFKFCSMIGGGLWRPIRNRITQNLLKINVVPHFDPHGIDAAINRPPGSTTLTVHLKASWVDGPSAVVGEKLIDSVEVTTS